MRSLFIALAGLLATGFAAAAPAAGQDVSILARQQRQIHPVVGAAKIVNSNDVYPRLPIGKLQSEEPDVWNMYLLAMEAVQNLPEDETISWYQIGGIHGAPFKPWDYNVPDQGFGYCTHGSVLFVTFHRPYMILLEQTLVEQAVKIAGEFSGEARSRYEDAARKVRLPFWDAFDKETGGAIPRVVTQQRINVVKPSGQQTIRNPLYSYQFQDEFRSTRLQDLANFGDLARDSESTIEPDNSVIAAQLEYRRGLAYDAFNLPNFSKFSTQVYTDAQTPDAQNSLEMIHNIVHGMVSGWMGYTTFAGFAPIFYLHHANIDRLGALYQAAHPESIDGQNALVRPFTGAATFGYPTQHTEDIDTRLYPFRHEGGNEFTSRDISSYKSIFEYGYSYEELPTELGDKPDDEARREALDHINRLYNPRFVPSRTSSSTSSRPTSTRSSSTRSSTSSATTTGVPSNSTISVPTGTGSVPTSLPTGTGISTPTGSAIPSVRPPFTNGTITPPSNSTLPPKNSTSNIPSTIEHEWACTVIVNNQEFDEALFSVYVHLGPDHSKPSSKDVVGSIASLGYAKDMKISGYVPLNRKLKDLGVDVNDLKGTVDYLKKNLGWKVYKGREREEVALEDMKSLKVGVSANKCAYFDNDTTRLPAKGEWGTFYEATEHLADKGGLTVKDKSLLKSQDIEKVTDKTELKPPVVKVIETVYVCPEGQKDKKKKDDKY